MLMLSLLSRWKKVTPKVHDEFEILFEDLKNFQFIDSGGQGAVYRAEHQGRIVAVKKVKDPKQIEIKCSIKLKRELVVFAMYYMWSKDAKISITLCPCLDTFVDQDNCYGYTNYCGHYHY